MFKNRSLLVIGIISILSVTMAVSYTCSSAPLVVDLAGSDFYQRRPNWTWVVNAQNAVIPATGASAFPDYAQRHLELSVSPILGLGAPDYFQRHPELLLSAAASVDRTDYYFRHPASLPSPTNIDLTDYFFRHP